MAAGNPEARRGADEGRRPVRSLREALAGYLETSGLARAGLTDQIGRAWVDMLGPAIANRTRLARTIRANVLDVEVDSPALLQELKGFRKAEILEGLRARVKRQYIEDIRFKLGAKTRPKVEGSRPREKQ
jgi:predicted nucleic acid-binding Zn ribbon protein